MVRVILKVLLFGLGFSAIGIGLSMFGLGVEATGQFFATIVNQFSNNPQELSDFSSASVDSEFRFFAVFWIAYGVILVKAARDLDTYIKRVPLLAGLFFAGGLGRILSINAVGSPHPLFTNLMIIELGLPVLIIGLWLGVRKNS